MGFPQDLAFTLYGHERGTWFWVPSEQSVDPRTGRPSSDKPRHPFVLASDYAGTGGAVAHPRSKTSREGVEHAPHPYDHERTCKINEKGRVLLHVICSIRPEAVCGENYSCVEPPGEVREALGDVQ